MAAKRSAGSSPLADRLRELAAGGRTVTIDVHERSASCVIFEPPDRNGMEQALVQVQARTMEEAVAKAERALKG